MAGSVETYEHPRCETFTVEKTELGTNSYRDLVAVCALVAPCDGTITPHAYFHSKLDGQKPSLAHLDATFLNAIFRASDFDFVDAHLRVDPTPVPVKKGQDIIFKTERNNSSAATQTWEMWLRFDPK